MLLQLFVHFFLVVSVRQVVAAPQVKINCTVINGVTSKNLKINSYYGIRFGQAPVGKLRFKGPIPYVLPEGVVNATEHGARCHQSIGLTNLLSRVRQSEDCLNLSIYTPSNATNLPVFFYIFGGGFAGQSNSDGMYNGERMITRTPDVIIVVINYRQGPFGFLASPQLAKDSPMNVGLLDQVLALQWVQDNIKYFGGDPTRVTAAGQSAGSLSIAAHMLANGGSQKLFSRAIMMGGNVLLQTPTVLERQEQFNGIATSLGCPLDDKVVDCLRGVDPFEFIEKAGANGMVIYGLTADEKYVLQDQITPLRKGAYRSNPRKLFQDPCVIQHGQR